MKADIIVDLQYGDSGKGKVAHYLCKTQKYTHVLRYNGGCNAGHTIFHKGKKFVTHHIPAGVFFGVPSIIGPGCVIDPVQFHKEIMELEAGGIRTKGKIFIATNTHVITDAHKKEDNKDKKIGTTKRGNGPAYRDKYARIGIRAKDVKELKPYLIDLDKAFHASKKEVIILGEGAQGFGLDIDWGDYPFVTSSHCTTAGFLLNGVPPQAVRAVWGIAKIYETYVGEKKFQPKDPVFKKLATLGEEFGATTGRARQCNWLDINLIERAIRMNGVTHIVFNKVDIMRKVGKWAVILDKKVKVFKSEREMKSFLTKRLKTLSIPAKHVYFSEDKEGL